MFCSQLCLITGNGSSFKDLKERSAFASKARLGYYHFFGSFCFGFLRFYCTLYLKNGTDSQHVVRLDVAHVHGLVLAWNAKRVVGHGHLVDAGTAGHGLLAAPDVGHELAVTGETHLAATNKERDNDSERVRSEENSDLR